VALTTLIVVGVLVALWLVLAAIALLMGSHSSAHHVVTVPAQVIRIGRFHH
jgi:hypothetical protein